MTSPDQERECDLSVDEAVLLLNGSGMWTTHAIERIGQVSVRLSDGPHGLRRQPEGGDHLGIGFSHPATCFPTGAALGSCWDPELLAEIGIALGIEAAAHDVDVLLGPGVNIKRSPLGGRNFEFFSEDPWLSGELGAAWVRGIQSVGVGASVKHFAAYNQETDRFRVDAIVDERTLRELYLPAFERVVREDPWTVMSAYNRLNGNFASQDDWLLNTVLRGEWGYEGVVVSDWGAVENPVAAVRAGLDLEMPSTAGDSATQLADALDNDTSLGEPVIRAAKRIQALEAKAKQRPTSRVPDFDAHHSLARQVAAQCIVLLTNDGTLPLDPTKDFCVVGLLAASPRIQGGGSSHVNPTRTDSPLSALRATRVREIAYAQGYDFDGDDDVALREEACSLARSHPVTVLFLGTPASDESEGYDRLGIELPQPQVDLLVALAATGTRVVVVLSNGGVISTAAWRQHASAIVEGWLLGQAGGGAISDVLTGSINPSGRLAETIPRSVLDSPSALSFPGELGVSRYSEGVFVGYRYYDTLGIEVDHPFGHGLSYTSFEYSDLRVSVAGLHHNIQVSVTATVSNVGSRAGHEVVQLYVHAPTPRVRRPAQELRGATRVYIEPGAKAEVAFELSHRDFAYFDCRSGSWRIDPGVVQVRIGASSRDIRLVDEFELELPAPEVELGPDSTFAEWTNDPIARAVLSRVMRNPDDGTVSRFLEPDYARTMASVSLRRLARFPITYLHGVDLDELTAEVTLCRGTSGHRDRVSSAQD